MNFSRKDHKIAVFLIGLVFFGSVSTASAFYFKNDIANFVRSVALRNVNKSVTVVPAKTVEPEVKTTPVVPAATTAEITKEPPKHSGTSKISGTTTTSQDGTKTTVVSDGGVSCPDLGKFADLASNGTSPAGIAYKDETGAYPALGGTLKNFLTSNLKWGNDIGYMYQITVQNAGDTGWEGQYCGAYKMNGNGKIVSAFGYIVLNTYYHKDSPNFTDYMQLTLSHEYGHHYTLYHKWIDLNLPVGARFPDSYYTTRPLSKEATATDYSKGWGNCEVEIMAEDYSYLYSGYNYHAMSKTYGYPSAAIKTWLENLSSVSASAPSQPVVTPPVPTPEPEPTPAETPATTPAPEPAATTAPVSDQSAITIINPATNPSTWASGRLTLEAKAAESFGAVKMEFYYGAQLLMSQDGNYIGLHVRYFPGNPGDYVFTAKAYDATGKIAEASVTVKKQ